MKYRKELAGEVIRYFSFQPGEVPPSMSGFRAFMGISLDDFARFCKRRDFAAALREAYARYCDTLKVGALLKRYDGAAVRQMLLPEESFLPADGRAGNPGCSVEVRVVE